jgi:O-antigen ligase
VLFYLTVGYLLLEFSRPQDLVSALAPLHLPGVVSVLLMGAVVLSRKVDLSDKETRWFVGFLALMALHVPLAANYYKVLQATRYVFMTFIVYLAIVICVDRLSKFRTLITLWLGVHLLLAVHGIAKHGQGIGGFLADENDFAMTMNMVVPVSLFLALSERNVTRKLLYMGLSGVFMLATIFSFSRGGFAGLVAAMLVCWARSPKKLRSAALIATLGLLVSVYAREGYVARLDSALEDSTGTVEDRLHMWKFGWRMFLDSPIIGVGPDNFPVRFGEYEGQDKLHGVTRVWRAAHSLYFTLFPELGLIGGFIFFKMLYYIRKDLAWVRQLSRQRPGGGEATTAVLPLAHAMEASLVGFLVSSLFLSTLYYPNFWIAMGFVVALRRIVAREATEASIGAVASGTLVRRDLQSRVFRGSRQLKPR